MCETNVWSDQPVYMIEVSGRVDAVVYVVNGVAFAARPREIYEALQVDAEVGPHRFAAATTIYAIVSDAWDRLDTLLLPRPTTVRGEAVDAVTCLSEWMDWCDAVTETAAQEAGVVWEGRTSERRADAMKWSARDVWAVTDAARLDEIYTMLAREEVAELTAGLDLHALRRVKAMLSTMASMTMAATGS